MYEKLAMDCRTLSRINVMFSNKAETYHDHKKQLFKMAASRKLESKIIDLRISFWSHRFLYKTMEFKPPSNTESKSNCYNSGGFQWISTSCWRRSVHTERGPHKNCPIIICWHMWHIWVRERFLVLLFRYPSYRPSWTHSTSTDSGY